MAPPEDRRSSRPVSFQIGSWRAEPARNRICSASDIRHLEPQVMDLLVLLAASGDRVVSKDEIVDRVWEGRFIAEATLTRTVADLRRALGDEARQPRYIETIPKRGYRLMAAVSSLMPADPVEPHAAAGARETARGSVGASPSLAVLPFADLGPGATDTSFGEGLTEEVINVLTRIPQLKVIARTSSFTAAALGGGIAEIGGRLGVTHVLEGSVRRADGRVRVAAQLIRVSDCCHVWSERYDRALADVFAIQDDLAQAIARRLELSLGDLFEPGRRPTSSVEAYTAYLQARHHFFKGTIEGLELSRARLNEAVVCDPGFAPAHDAMSELYWYMGFYGALVPKEAFLRAVWETLRALEIDDTMAEAHAQLAMLRKELDYNWPEVRRELARARALAPRSPTVRLRYAIAWLMPFGRVDEAAAELETVLDADPLSPFVRWWLAAMRFLAGDAAGVLDETDRLLAVDPHYPPGHQVRSAAYLLRGEAGRAVACCERAVELGSGAPWLQGWLGQAYALAGRAADAVAVRDRLVALSASRYVPPTAIAWISLALGDLDDGFARMEAAIEMRDPFIMPIRSYPFLVPLRSDPRYARLLERMNLA